MGPVNTGIGVPLVPPWFRQRRDISSSFDPIDKVKSLDHIYKNSLNILAETRSLQMLTNERNPVPSFPRIAEHRVTFDYSGVRKVIRRRSQ